MPTATHSLPFHATPPAPFPLNDAPVEFDQLIPLKLYLILPFATESFPTTTHILPFQATAHAAVVKTSPAPLPNQLLPLKLYLIILLGVLSKPTETQRFVVEGLIFTKLIVDAVNEEIEKFVPMPVTVDVKFAVFRAEPD